MAHPMNHFTGADSLLAVCVMTHDALDNSPDWLLPSSGAVGLSRWQAQSEVSSDRAALCPSIPPARLHKGQARAVLTIRIRVELVGHTRNQAHARRT